MTHEERCAALAALAESNPTVAAAMASRDVWASAEDNVVFVDLTTGVTDTKLVILPAAAAIKAAGLSYCFL